MKSLWIKLILVAALIVAGNYLSTAQTPEELYQKGLMKEEGEGALQDAIILYDQIADNSDADQSLRAKALLHIGMCYEKMGTEEAVKAYQQIVDKFPTQKNEVAIARARLSKLQHVEKISVTTPNPVFTKIHMPVKLARGAQLSPDGKKLTFSSTMYEGSIWTVPIPGKTGPDIAGEPEKLIGDENVWTWGHAWSADGKWIAYNYMKNDKEKDIFVDEVHVLSYSGGNTQKIALPVNRGGSYNLFQYSLSLSPDGSLLAYASKEEGKSYKTKESYIYTIPVNGGAATQITDSETWLPAFSPDGKRIAYIKESAEEDELWVIQTHGGTPIKICSLGGKAGGPPLWSPNSDWIAYLRDQKHEECREIWFVLASENGSSIAPPKKIDLSLEPSINIAGWTRDNKIGLFLLSPVHQAIYTIPSSGGKATQVTPADGQSFSPSWNPTGKKIYYFNKNSLFSADTESGETSAIPISGMKTVNYPYVSPDGEKVLFYGYKEGIAGMHLWTVPIKGGEPTQITKSPHGDSFCHWSPDGKTISFWRQELSPDGVSVTNSICLVSAEGGDVKVLVSDPDKRMDEINPGPFVGHPTVNLLFITAMKTGRLKLSRVDNREAQVLTELEEGIQAKWLSFSPSGKKILYTAKGKMWTVSLNGNEPLEIETGLELEPFTPSWSPDEQKIAFPVRKGGEIELWMMKNFLPLEDLPQNSETRIAAKPEGIRIRQVWKKPYLDFLGSVSSDGMLLSYIDWGQGDVAVHNLMTGEDQVLIHEADLDTIPESFAQSPKISKDGSKIAYFLWNPYHTFDLRLTDVNNPSSKLIYKEEGVEVYPADWLSDHELIAYRQNRNTENTSISLFNISDGTYRDLKNFEGRTWAQIAASPDEKYIAYDFKNKKTDGNYDIGLLPVDGSGEISLISHPANDKVLGWDPKNNVFLFISDRSGDWDLWALPVSEGKSPGQANRLYTGIGEVEPMGLSENGDCYFGFSKRFFNTSLAPFNSLTGEIQEESGVSLEGSNFWLTWSPDGQSLAYIKEDRSADTHWQLTIKDLKTGEERRLGNNLHAEAPAWSPDGNSILFKGRDANKSRLKGDFGDIYLADIKTGHTEKILSLSNFEFNLPEDDSPPLSALSWSPDGKSIFMLFYKDRLIKHDLKSGEDEVIIEHSNFEPYILKFSPDGSTLLFGTQNNGEKSRLFTMPAGGGNMVEMCRAQESEDFVSANWSPDGKYIYFSERPEETNLWRIPAKGGKPQKVWHSENRTAVYDIHPDGNQIAISQRVRTTEVRVIENLTNEITRVFNIIE